MARNDNPVKIPTTSAYVGNSCGTVCYNVFIKLTNLDKNALKEPQQNQDGCNRKLLIQLLKYIKLHVLKN